MTLARSSPSALEEMALSGGGGDTEMANDRRPTSNADSVNISRPTFTDNPPLLQDALSSLADLIVESSSHHTFGAHFPLIHCLCCGRKQAKKETEKKYREEVKHRIQRLRESPKELERSLSGQIEELGILNRSSADDVPSLNMVIHVFHRRKVNFFASPFLVCSCFASYSWRSIQQ